MITVFLTNITVILIKKNRFPMHNEEEDREHHEAPRTTVSMNNSVTTFLGEE
ncbi:MAG: hypothetical protein K0R67_737 [Paenibacillus sp.]|jgi:hypothetical protein|nr:hypothetical protein [Paenibacillus sp.]